MEPGTIERVRIIRARISLIRQQLSMLRIVENDLTIEIEDFEKVIGWIKQEDKGTIPDWKLYPPMKVVNIEVDEKIIKGDN